MRLLSPTFLEQALTTCQTFLPPCRHKIVIFEGLYLSLDEPVWSEISALMNERIAIRCPFEVAMERVTHRHVRTGICEFLTPADLPP